MVLLSASGHLKLVSSADKSLFFNDTQHLSTSTSPTTCIYIVVRLLLGDQPAVGHLQVSVCRLQTPAAKDAHEMSLGKFVLEHFSQLTLDVQTGVVSDKDTTEIWESRPHSHINGSQDLCGRPRMGGRKVVPLVVRQRRERENLGIGTEDGKKIIHRLDYTLLNEHEKLSSWKLLVTDIRTPQQLVALAGERHIGPCLSSSLGGIGPLGWGEI